MPLKRREREPSAPIWPPQFLLTRTQLAETDNSPATTDDEDDETDD